MNMIIKDIFNIYSSSFHVIKTRLYSKSSRDLLKIDTEVHEFVTKNKRPKQNFLASMGVATTGALGIRNLINNERKTGNLHIARRPYPLYFFNDFDGVKTSIRNVACGYGFTLFSGRSKPNWKVYGCGLNNDSQLGLQIDVHKNSQGYEIITDPRIIDLPSNVDRITDIACGRAHSIVVASVDSADGERQVVYSFGNNVYGQCGREIVDGEIFYKNGVINKVDIPKRIKKVECGELTTFFLMEDGSVYGCGNNMHGQLGHRDFTVSSSVVRIGGGLDCEVVKDISCRSNTVLALTEKGEVWAWGCNEFRLVYSDECHSSVTEPQRLEMPATVGAIVHISAGNTVCAVVDDQGKVHIWGSYLVGLGPSKQIAPWPTMIPPGLFGGSLGVRANDGARVVRVACGMKQCLAVTASGSLYHWGEDGRVKTGPQTFPVRVPLTFNVTRVFLGADHSIMMGSPDM